MSFVDIPIRQGSTYLKLWSSLSKAHVSQMERSAATAVFIVFELEKPFNTQGKDSFIRTLFKDRHHVNVQETKRCLDNVV